MSTRQNTVNFDTIKMIINDYELSDHNLFMTMND